MPIKVAKKDIQLSLTVKDKRIIWRERDADFYRSRFARAYSPEGAAANWNVKTAGKPPAWKYSKELSDYACTMMMQRVPLKQIAAALGEAYGDLVDDVAALADSKKLDGAKEAVKSAVELIDGKPHWKVRTTAAFPKTPAAKLIDFNTNYAGRPIAPRKDGTYRVRFYYVTLDQIKGWLK